MNLFAYGTLMDPEIMARVSGLRPRSENAALDGYVRKAVRGEVYPAITPRKGARVHGVLYFDLSPEAVERLDRFEGQMYRRRAVTVTAEAAGSQATAVETYVIAPENLDRLSNEDWRFDEFLKTGKGRFQRSYEGYGKLE